MSITVLVPTKNRYNYLVKLLNFYNETNFKHTIFVLDSSKKEIRHKNFKLINKYKKLRLKYFYREGWPCEVMKNISEKIKTKYCCFTGDDDFLLQKGLDKCSSYLNKNQNFIGCFGKIILYNIIDKNKFIQEYTAANKRIEKSSYSRIIKLISDYSVLFFGLTRTIYFKKALRSVPSLKNRHLCPSKHIANEYILSFSLAALGKFQKINDLQLVRFVGHQNAYQILLDKNFKIALNYMSNKLLKIITNNNKYNNSTINFKKNFVRLFEYDFFKNKKRQNLFQLFLNFLKIIKVYNIVSIFKKLYIKCIYISYKKKYKFDLDIIEKIYHLGEKNKLYLGD